MGNGVQWFGLGTQDRVESIVAIGPRGGRVGKFAAYAGGLHLGDYARKSKAIGRVEYEIEQRRIVPVGDVAGLLSDDWAGQSWQYISLSIEGKTVLTISRPRVIGDSFWTVSNRAGKVVLQTRFKPSLATVCQIANRQQRYCDDCQMVLTSNNPDSVCVDCQCKRVETAFDPSEGMGFDVETVTESPVMIGASVAGSNEIPAPLYQVQFTQNGAQVQLWTGYTSHGEALRAIRDADSIIPFSWDYQIQVQPNAILAGTPQ